MYQFLSFVYYYYYYFLVLLYLYDFILHLPNLQAYVPYIS
jgi:hypothetical protein